ncbi:MAG: hypothetical protein IBX69_19480 [Anaerolineales bacterium]|nr:hypothetical protein [Anaerolineales bacterium]
MPWKPVSRICYQSPGIKTLSGSSQTSKNGQKNDQANDDYGDYQAAATAATITTRGHISPRGIRSCGLILPEI